MPFGAASSAIVRTIGDIKDGGGPGAVCLPTEGTLIVSTTKAQKAPAARQWEAKQLPQTTGPRQLGFACRAIYRNHGGRCAASRNLDQAASNLTMGSIVGEGISLIMTYLQQCCN